MVEIVILGVHGFGAICISILANSLSQKLYKEFQIYGFAVVFGYHLIFFSFFYLVFVLLDLSPVKPWVDEIERNMHNLKGG